MDEIAEKIKQLLISDLQVDPDVLARSDLQTPLLGRGIGLDSMEALTLALALEREFDLQVRDEDLTVELFASIGNLAEYVLHSQSQVDRDSE
jgi:acyl carrier protein